MTPKTFEDYIRDPVSTVYADFYERGIRCRVLRGPASLVAYIGVPPDCGLAGKDYDDVDLQVHGGLTFSQVGGKSANWPEGYYWLGWDYAHLGDVSFYDGKYGLLREGSHKWTISEVVEDARRAARDAADMIDRLAAAQTACIHCGRIGTCKSIAGRLECVACGAPAGRM